MKSHATLPIFAVLFLLLASRGCDSKPWGKNGQQYTFPSLFPMEPCSLPTKELKCCGSKSYNPTSQTCCDTNVQNIPSAESDCCSGMAHKKTARNRNPCIRQCGQQRVEYNTETQMCNQQGKVINLDDKNATTGVVIPVHGLPSPKPPLIFPDRVDPRRENNRCSLNFLSTKKSRRQRKWECCGFRSYNPSSQTCCDNTVYDIPSSESECCNGMMYNKTDGDKNKCLRKCGRLDITFNTETHICCGGKVSKRKEGIIERCCGHTPMNPRHQTCCGGTPVETKTMECCENTTPYFPHLLECDKSTKRVLPTTGKLQNQDLANKICRKTVETMPETARTLYLESMVQLQGRVESCRISKRSTSITIPLAPVLTIQGGRQVSKCIKNNRLRLVIELPKEQDCESKRNLKRYFRDKTVNVYVPLEKINCRQIRKGKLHLEPRDAVLMLLSKRMDFALMESVTS